eukprot:TRINITY_DN1183_c4_g1_i1.p1 TRINITY_DN1183_c4_g1~~TRINITY_DN1183_c4_g1_i1.p1  ORF type:complete len:222 (-),score=96.94 TRINITY_DN1183_c4_g1_i1:29-694(-)
MIDGGYGSGYTLMGHEYVECKNYGKAIEVYRKAVEVNNKDYRAWYALGQTFEILKMSGKAVYYYQNAARWRKEDSRMWSALGECYGTIPGREMDAIKAWKFARSMGDKEKIACGKIAELYREIGEREKAGKWYRLNVEEKERERKKGGGGERELEEMVEGWSFLANWEWEKGEEEEREGKGGEERWRRAKEWCWKLMDVVGKQREMAKSLLVRIEERLQEK